MLPSFQQTNTVLLSQVSKCHNVYEGSEKVHEYLTKSKNESALGYSTRVEISACATIFKKGINSFVDILFRDSLTYSDDMPENIVEYYDSADGKRSLNEVAKQITKEILLSNKVYVLVWTPQSTATNAKEEQQQGVRPYIEIITRDRIIDSVTKRDTNGNIERIGVIGSYIESETRYEIEEGVENRVYFNDGTTEIFRKYGGGFVLHDTIESDVKDMHILELTLDDIVDSPPFINEANTQLQHYNLESAKDAYNVQLAFPFIVTHGMMQNNRDISVNGTDDDGNTIQVVEFQANKGIDFAVNPETGAKLGDVTIKELSGSADAVLKSSIDDKKMAIIDGFVKMVGDSSGNKTTQQSESERVSGESTLAALSDKIEDFLNDIHALFSAFLSMEVKGYISVNKEFIEQGLSELKYKMLSDLYADETLDRRAYIEELQNLGELTTLDVDELEARLLANGKS